MSRYEDDEDDAEVLMPFGRHEGTPVNKLPRAYLCWASSITLRSARLAEAIDAAHRRFCTLRHDEAWR